MAKTRLDLIRDASDAVTRAESDAKRVRDAHRPRDLHIIIRSDCSLTLSVTDCGYVAVEFTDDCKPHRGTLTTDKLSEVRDWVNACFKTVGEPASP